ncbi:DUF3140 domain-containing protein [Pseudonocardia dioxanivorans]|uniref:DUF3140 domain-containing protein n=1 Tax=Pseudonocardia dioxanivorans TaxID=240495 RepID=UPI000CD2A513|nr:DUF3140 domain-containing protein [Pseudonocardia dioxanivorans]
MAEQRDIRAEFDEAVDMSAEDLERWLGTDESKDAGQSDGGESTGHRAGRRIVEILRTRPGDPDDADEAHMRTVVGYVHRHLARRPDGDVTDTRWRHSLMNWGHDPLR